MARKASKRKTLTLTGTAPLKTRFREKSAVPGDPNFILAVGLSLDKTQITKPYAQNPWVYAAVNAIAWNLSAAPFAIRSGTKKDPKEVEEGPWVDLFDAPNRAMSKSDFWRLHMIYLLNCGEVIWVLHSKDGKPYEMGDIPASIVPHPPDRFEPVKNGAVIQAWKYRSPNGGEILLNWWEVIQFKLPNPYNPMRGLSPLDAAMLDIRQDYKASLFNESFFDNGCDMGGVITTGQRLTTDQRSQAAKKIEDRHKGSDKRGRVLVLGSGEEYTPNTQNHLDMQFLDGRKWARDVIATVFRVPKQILSVYEDINFATAQIQEKSFWTGTVIPYMKDIEDVLWHQLFRRVDDGKFWGIFDLAGIEALNAGFKEKVDTAKVLSDMGYSTNEVNDRLDLGMPKQEEAVDLGPDAVQDTALNGAQISGLLEIVAAVSEGTLDSKGAVALIMVAFPTIDEKEAKRILAGVDVTGPDPTVSPTEPDPGTPAKTKAMEPAEAERLKGIIAAYIQKAYPARERRWSNRLRIYFGRQRAEVLANLERADNDGKQKDLDMSDMDAILFADEEWDRKLRQMAKPLYREAANAEIATISSELGGLESFTAQDPNLLRYLSAKELKVAGINRTVKDALRLQLREGIANGETLEQIRDRIKGVYNIVGGESRRRTIARTETAEVMNNTRALGFKEEGVEFVQWLTAEDDAVRDSHQENAGDIRKMGEEFSNGMKWPSESGAPPEEVINCRCSILAVKSEEDQG